MKKILLLPFILIFIFLSFSLFYNLFYSWKLTKVDFYNNKDSILNIVDFIDKRDSINLISSYWITWKENCSWHDCEKYYTWFISLSFNGLSFINCWEHIIIHKECHPDFYCNWLIYKKDWFNSNFPKWKVESIDNNFILYNNLSLDKSYSITCKIY